MKMKNRYTVKEILDMEISSLPHTNIPFLTIKDYLKTMFLEIGNKDLDHSERLNTLFIGFVENGLIKGFTHRDDGLLLEYQYEYSDAMKLYQLLINTLFDEIVNSHFFVKDKTTQQIYGVISIRNDKNGYPHFLIYKNNSWVWKSAKYFEIV